MRAPDQDEVLPQDRGAPRHPSASIVRRNARRSEFERTPMHPSRRSFLAGLAAATAPLGARAAPVSKERLNDATKRLAGIEARAGGRLGVFVRDTGTGSTLAHRAGE